MDFDLENEDTNVQAQHAEAQKLSATLATLIQEYGSEENGTEENALYKKLASLQVPDILKSDNSEQEVHDCELTLQYIAEIVMMKIPGNVQQADGSIDKKKLWEEVLYGKDGEHTDTMDIYSSYFEPTQISCTFNLLKWKVLEDVENPSEVQINNFHSKPREFHKVSVCGALQSDAVFKMLFISSLIFGVLQIGGGWHEPQEN